MIRQATIATAISGLRIEKASRLRSIPSSRALRVPVPRSGRDCTTRRSDAAEGQTPPRDNVGQSEGLPPGDEKGDPERRSLARPKLQNLAPPANSVLRQREPTSNE